RRPRPAWCPTGAGRLNSDATARRLRPARSTALPANDARPGLRRERAATGVLGPARTPRQAVLPRSVLDGEPPRHSRAVLSRRRLGGAADAALRHLRQRL